MATHLVTGYAGSEHIKSEDQGSFNASFFGTGQFVMEAGNQLEASILDNNTVRILDGDILMKGRHIRINSNTYEDMIIETGTAGVNRCDLIVMEYSKDATTGIETAFLRVLKGAETAGAAEPPAYTDGNILNGAKLNQMPLYKVLIEGVVLVDIICLFNTIPTYETLAERYRQKFIKDCQTHLDSLGVLDTMEEIEANTQSDQLAGALSLKEMNATHKSDIAAVNKSMAEGIKGVEDSVEALNNKNAIKYDAVTSYIKADGSLGNTEYDLNAINNMIETLLDGSYFASETYTNATLDGVIYEGMTEMQFLRMAQSDNGRRALFIGCVMSSDNMTVWNKYVMQNRVLYQKRIDDVWTEWTSLNKDLDWLGENVLLKSAVTVSGTKLTINLD